jgi:hypothetical protein
MEESEFDEDDEDFVEGLASGRGYFNDTEKRFNILHRARNFLDKW